MAIEKRRAVELWRCGDCGEIHDKEYEAKLCCAPDPEEIWGCPECGKGYDTEAQADACCDAGSHATCPSCLRDYSSRHVNALAIEFAGHCNTCNPIFTHEQQFAIERCAYLHEFDGRLI